MICYVTVSVLCWLAASPVSAFEITLDRPGNREFARDLADMLDEDAEDRIRQLCDRLLTAKAALIIVVTIESMAKRGGAGMRIETFATLLFNQWQIGHESLGDQYWNTGILLLVSKGDRRRTDVTRQLRPTRRFSALTLPLADTAWHGQNLWLRYFLLDGRFTARIA